jgi:hypothetical protein
MEGNHIVVYGEKDNYPKRKRKKKKEKKKGGFMLIYID